MISPIGMKRKLVGKAIGLTVLLVLLSGWSYAQTAADPELAAAISGRKKVRVLLPSGSLVLRRPVITAEGLGYQVRRGGREEQAVVPWTGIRTVQVRRSGVGKGALIGAGMGAVLGLALGLSATGECTGWIDLFCELSAGGVALVTAAGSASGGLIGAGIGALAGRWGTVYRQASPVQKLPLVSIAPARGGGFVFSLSMSL